MGLGTPMYERGPKLSQEELRRFYESRARIARGPTKATVQAVIQPKPQVSKVIPKAAPLQAWQGTGILDYVINALGGMVNPVKRQ